MNTPIYKTADGRIYPETDYYEYGVIHQMTLWHTAQLSGENCEPVRVSCDNGEHWDWEYGRADGTAGWHRRAEA